ncbi:MAG: hypothetical protein LBU61_00380 [Coriobacteriales bacterium]|jgi:exopolyphosphatase/guanosine-5'-triphosphate,3'-diphosphate pyrophosphatase|nr:hypothetical protein [Coriobacteriales bacterium]
MRLAALDYGTVTSRLLVAEVDAGLLKPLLKKTTITHMGENLADTNSISEAAATRVVEASMGFLADIAALDLIDSLGSKDESLDSKVKTSVVAVATSAMRDALNSNQLIDKLAILGINVEVIAGQREAALSFAGTLSGFASESIMGQSILVVDVGGGSTELIVGRIETKDSVPQILSAASIDIGARRVTDRWLKSDPSTNSELADARQWVRHQLKDWYDDINKQGLSIDHSIAVAGTPTTLVAIREQMAEYDPELVHGQTVTSQELDRIFQLLASMTIQERYSVVGLERGRAPVVIGGILVLDEVMRLVGLSETTVSETDILQGIILDTWLRSTIPLF